MDLVIRTDNGDFDLFGNEDIVQTFSIFNLEDITSRSSEYTNVFKLPLTNNNIQIIEYANLIISINTLPYKKTSCSLLIDGFEFKKGFIMIESIDEFINARFFSGNSTFYDLLKTISLPQLNWSSYNHIWNYTNALASSANTYGYVYPIINYNGQNLSGDIIDVRKVYPATFAKTILDFIMIQLGYTYSINIDTTDFDTILIPSTNKNQDYDANYLLLNKLDGTCTTSYNSTGYYNYAFDIFTAIHSTEYNPTVAGQSVYMYDFSSLYFSVKCPLNSFAIGTSAYWNNSINEYVTVARGMYDYSFLLNSQGTLASTIQVTSSNIHTTDMNVKQLNYHLQIIHRDINGVENVINDVLMDGTATGNIFLEAGESLYARAYLTGYFLYSWDQSTIHSNIDINVNLQIKNNCHFVMNLQPNSTFGNLLTYSNMLPNIKCSDFIKDICIRFGLIINVNEDTKEVTFNPLDTLINNIPNKLNWSNKLNDSDFPISKFSYNNYAQHNIFDHTEDKTINNIPIGSSFDLTINNQNLELTKVIYKSPFGVSENNTFTITGGNIITTYIDSYDTTSSKFSKDVKPRICFSEPVIGKFKFTDGTTTSGYINTRRLWFIDQLLPNQSMGFGLNLIPKNSITLITTLQNLRLMKLKFNLNFIDIKNLDYFTPIYLEQYQSYFFISSINQFNYTNPNLTEVELIKLNP